MSVKTVKVSNLSLGASERDVREFFSFSGDIVYVETQSFNERSQIAFVTFTDCQGAETAVLLSGATIVDATVTVTLDPEYQLPPAATAATPPYGSNAPAANDSALRKAEDVVTSMFAKGFVLGKDAVSKAKTFDEKHGFTSTASAKVASLDKKIGFTEKVNVGTSIVSDKVKEVDQKLQVSEKAKSAFTAAENTVSNAGSAIMKNRYVFTSASWVTGAFNKVAKAAAEVGQQTKEKVEKTEDEKRRKMVDDYAEVHLSDSPTAPDANEQHHPSKPAPVTDNMTFENSDEGGESTQELQNLIKELGYRNAMDVEDVLTHPEENVVAQLLTDEEIIESVIGINKDDIDEEDDESSTMEPPSRNEAIKAAITLNNFLLSYEKTTPEVLTMLRKIRDEIQGEIDFNKKQKTIESFFKKPS